MLPTNDGFKKKNFIINKRKSKNLIAKINHRNDAKKMKRLINCEFDNEHITSPFHDGLFHLNLAINA